MGESELAVLKVRGPERGDCAGEPVTSIDTTARMQSAVVKVSNVDGKVVNLTSRVSNVDTKLTNVGDEGHRNGTRLRTATAPWKAQEQ